MILPVNASNFLTFSCLSMIVPYYLVNLIIQQLTERYRLFYGYVITVKGRCFEINKKLYYTIITPLIILGFVFPAIRIYLLAVLILVASCSLWIESREKLKKTEGEEEISRIIVPLILFMLFLVLFIISLF